MDERPAAELNLEAPQGDWPSQKCRENVIAQFEQLISPMSPNLLLQTNLPGNAKDIEDFVYKKSVSRDDYMRTITKVINAINSKSSHLVQNEANQDNESSVSLLMANQSHLQMGFSSAVGAGQQMQQQINMQQQQQQQQQYFQQQQMLQSQRMHPQSQKWQIHQMGQPGPMMTQPMPSQAQMMQEQPQLTQPRHVAMAPGFRQQHNYERRGPSQNELKAFANSLPHHCLSELQKRQTPQEKTTYLIHLWHQHQQMDSRQRAQAVQLPTSQQQSIQPAAGQRFASATGYLSGQSHTRPAQQRLPGPGFAPPPATAHHPGQHPASVEAASSAECQPVEATGPSSVPIDPLQNQQEQEAYARKLESLRHYLEPCKRQVDRQRIDGTQDTKFEKLLEVMENKRRVKLELLDKLLANAKQFFEKPQMCKPLLDALQTTVNAGHSDILNRSLFEDPWKSVEHMSLQLPEECRLTVDAREGLTDRCGEGSAVADSHLVQCLDGSVLSLPAVLTAEIAQFNSSPFRIQVDPQLRPLSNDCGQVNLLVTTASASLLRLPPLAVSVPVSYPKKAPRIASSSYRSLTATPLFVQIEKVMRQRLRLLTGWKSITDLVIAWESAIEHCRTASIMSVLS